MAITYEGVLFGGATGNSVSNDTDSTTGTVGATAANNLLVLIGAGWQDVQTGWGVATPTWLTGGDGGTWSAPVSVTQTLNGGTNGTSGVWMSYLIAANTTTGTVNQTYTNAMYGDWGIFEFSTNEGAFAYEGQGTSATTNTASATSLTPTNPASADLDSVAIGVCGGYAPTGSPSIATPAGFTNAFKQSSDSTNHWSGDYIIQSALASAAYTFTGLASGSDGLASVVFRFGDGQADAGGGSSIFFKRAGGGGLVGPSPNRLAG